MSWLAGFVEALNDRLNPPGSVEFLCEHPQLNGAVPAPVPAATALPGWMAALENFDHSSKRNMFEADERRVFPLPTAKRCVPMVDGMGLGWLMPLAADLRVQTNEDATAVRFNWTAPFMLGELHEDGQVGPDFGGPGGRPVVKIINPWVVRTPPGWSTLFIEPMNRPNEFFTPLGALVATDIYPRTVNFPGFFAKPNLDVILKAGTPLVQAIPVRRRGPPRKAVVACASREDIAAINIVATKQLLGEGYYRHEVMPKTRDK